MTTTLPTQLTLAAFLAQPETKPASEFVDGTITQKPMPQGEHSLLQGELCAAINQIVKKQKLAYAFPELRCTYPSGSHPTDVYGGASIVPDVTVFRWDRIPRQPSGRIVNRFELHPDWTIEVLSPNQSRTKVERNILHCLEHGTDLGWLLDPDAASVRAFLPNREPILFGGPDAILPVPTWLSSSDANLQLTLATLFGWLSL